MKVDEYEVPEGYYYHKEHTWVKKEEHYFVVGVTDFAQKLAGEIKRVQTLEEEDEVESGEPFGTLSSGKWTGKLISPVSGEIVAVNEEVTEENPGLINESPYDKGWIIKIKPSDPSEIDNLMVPGEDLEKWLREEIKKYKK